MAHVSIRTAQVATTFPASGSPSRQDIGAFGPNATPGSTDKLAAGSVACDTDGVALMGRTVHASAADTATTTPAQALAAYAKRDEAVIQNVDAGSGVLLVWMTGHATAKFRVLPGGSFVWRGADEIMVATASGTADWVAVDR